MTQADNQTQAAERIQCAAISMATLDFVSSLVSIRKTVLLICSADNRVMALVGDGIYPENMVAVLKPLVIEQGELTLVSHTTYYNIDLDTFKHRIGAGRMANIYDMTMLDSVVEKLRRYGHGKIGWVIKQITNREPE